MADVLIYGAGAIGSFIGYLLSDDLEIKARKVESVCSPGKREPYK